MTHEVKSTEALLCPHLEGGALTSGHMTRRRGEDPVTTSRATCHGKHMSPGGWEGLGQAGRVGLALADFGALHHHTQGANKCHSHSLLMRGRGLVLRD